MSLKTSWDLSLLVPDFNEETVEKAKTELLSEYQVQIDRWKNTDTWLSDSKVLKEALDSFENLISNGGVGGEMGYAILLYCVLDQISPERRALSGRFTEFERKLSNEIAFFNIRLSKVSKEQQQVFLMAPELTKYKKHLQGIFEEADHVLSEPEERLETLKAGVSVYNWVAMLEGLLAEETRVVEGKERTMEELLSLLIDQNKAIRDQAVTAINEILSKYRKVAENEMNSLLENKKIEDEVRGWPHPESYRLFSDDVSKQTVDTMLEVVSGSNQVAREYYELKAAVLGVKSLGYHEKSLSVADVEKKFTYEEGYGLVKKSVGQLDQEFADILERYSEKGQIDVYPAKGKSDGAACWAGELNQPTYIFLNWTDTIHDVTTLAHELGHGVNNELIKQKQGAYYFGTPLSTAEVASTFMEDFVFQELLQGVTPEERLALLFEKLDGVIATTFRQVACYQFEKEMHATFREKGYLSADEIGGIFKKYMTGYLGDSIEFSPENENWWIYWGHIRRYFYVYSYASGLLISMGLQRKVRENPAFIKEVKEFMSAGMSDTPENIFARCGIDITDKTFWEEGVAEIRVLLDEAKKLAGELGRI